MKKWLNQAEIIKDMSDRELLTQLVLSQLILLSFGFIGSFVFFDTLSEWLSMFQLNEKIFFLGVLSGVFFVLLDLIIMKYLPEKYYDDGGINRRIFQNRSFWQILIIALFVAISEELLFRGVIQTTFGYVMASSLFALVHIRYLFKPVPFISILFISFYLGYIFEITGNLNVTIAAHFIVDFLLGLHIRYKMR
ncbi:MAG: CPBP family intramembrane metalloprotease [Bacillaceae bacterium]|nr:CPBP family intramembrane metalloprotease [Bacillaceae bacterium]